MIKWIRTSRLSIKDSLSGDRRRAEAAEGENSRLREAMGI